jgi:hypothetical protein
MFLWCTSPNGYLEAALLVKKKEGIIHILCGRVKEAKKPKNKGEI